MAASNLDLTTSSTLKSSSRTSAAGASKPPSSTRQHGRTPRWGGREMRRGIWPRAGSTSITSPAHLSSPSLASSQVCSPCIKSDLASPSSCKAGSQPGSCRRSAPSTHRPRPPRPPSRHTAASYSQICRSQGARVRPGVGRCDYAPRTLSIDNIA